MFACCMPRSFIDPHPKEHASCLLCSASIIVSLIVMCVLLTPLQRLSIEALLVRPILRHANAGRAMSSSGTRNM
ncbi:hypothetical protein GQ54DRAFT_58423 [Martensiomyces pterosporus]|nr:hypothetical protein GQ54DRAFT_58423 [Martensiomyces pterosporus]